MESNWQLAEAVAQAEIRKRGFKLMHPRLCFQRARRADGAKIDGGGDLTMRASRIRAHVPSGRGLGWGCWGGLVTAHIGWAVDLAEFFHDSC